MTAPQKYRTIVADPPWDYGKDADRWPTAPSRQRITRPAMPYLAMTLDAICALPVSDLAEPDACLWLWTTSRFLPVSFRVLAAWGFTYRQTLVGIKASPSPFGGSICPNGAEFVLFGKRGDPQTRRAKTSSVFEFPGRRAHSAKPESLLDLAEATCPGPYLELFARRNRFGWDTWGLECLDSGVAL